MPNDENKPGYSFSDEPCEGIYLTNGEVVSVSKGGTVRATAADVMRSMWRPIATAPRDGTWILLAGGRTDEDFYTTEEDPPCINRVVTGAWSADECADVTVYSDDDEYVQIDWWMMTFWDGSWRSGYIAPTHWMPLPEAPEGV